MMAKDQDHDCWWHWGPLQGESASWGWGGDFVGSLPAPSISRVQLKVQVGGT